jgi:hypothetical protein
VTFTGVNQGLRDLLTHLEHFRPSPTRSILDEIGEVEIELR